MHPSLLRDLAGGLGALALTAGATWLLLGLSTTYLAAAGTLFAITALLLRRSPDDLDGLGPAGRITLARAGLVFAVAPLGWVGAPHGPAALWWVVTVGTVALLLDGVDGWAARKTGTSTAFGARFDMELDAFLILALSILVWRQGRAGAWVVAMGGLRYLFVGAGWVWPWLRGDLPPRLRRKVICVLQGVALLVALGPVIPGPVAWWVLAVALALLVGSFAADVIWLRRRSRDGSGGHPGTPGGASRPGLHHISHLGPEAVSGSS